jgi:hypothetical protein
MNANTQHNPWSSHLSAADQAAEQMRANSGSRPDRLPEVPAEWQDRFSPAEWAAYQRERFDAWHSFAVANLSPLAYLNGVRCKDMV